VRGGAGRSQESRASAVSLPERAGSARLSAARGPAHHQRALSRAWPHRCGARLTQQLRADRRAHLGRCSGSPQDPTHRLDGKRVTIRRAQKSAQGGGSRFATRPETAPDLAFVFLQQLVAHETRSPLSATGSSDSRPGDVRGVVIEKFAGSLSRICNPSASMSVRSPAAVRREEDPTPPCAVGFAP